jgi:apolipoprotein D and lipocalin family protein
MERCGTHRVKTQSRMVRRAFLALALSILATGSLLAEERDVNGDPAVPFRVVAALDLDRYAGQWFEIARFPNRYQRNCAAVLAEYTPRPDGHYDVRGTCPDRRPGRRAASMEGVARLDGPAELSVGLTSWMPFFRRSVFVMDMAPDYSVAVVGEPRRKYAWIMARTPEVSDAEYARALAVLAESGYFVDLLERLPPADVASRD